MSCVSVMSCGSDSSDEPNPEQERLDFFYRLQALANDNNLDEFFKLYGINASTSSLKFGKVCNSEKADESLYNLQEPSDTLLLFELKGNSLWIGAYDAGSTKEYFEFTDQEVSSSISSYVGYGETNTYQLKDVQVGDFRLNSSTLGSDRYVFDVTFYYGNANTSKPIVYTYFYTKGDVSRCPGMIQGYWYDEDYLWTKVNDDTRTLLNGKGISEEKTPYIYIYNLKGKQQFFLTEEDVESYTTASVHGYSTHWYGDNFFDNVRKGICYETTMDCLSFNLSEKDGITINVESQFHTYDLNGSRSYIVEPIYIERFSYSKGKMSLLWHNANIPKFTGFVTDHFEWNDGVKWVTVKDKHYVTVLDYTEPKLKFKIENLSYDGLQTDSTYIVNVNTGELLK